MNDLQTSLDRYNKAVDTLIDALRKENEELREHKKEIKARWAVLLTGITIGCGDISELIAGFHEDIMRGEDDHI